MRVKNRLFPLFIVLIFMMLHVQAAASEIQLDGSFGDWTNKPSLAAAPTVSGNDAITLVKWFPDPSSNALYFLAERAYLDDKRYNFSDWEFTVTIKGDTGTKRLYVHYHPSSKFVDLDLYNEQNRWVWGVKGKWGDWHDDGNTIEFMMPLGTIISDIHVGYEVQIYFESNDNRLPVSGTIMISTISTFPVFPAAAACVMAGAASGLYLRNKSKRKTIITGQF